jgi:hypothetical protein
MPTVMQQAIAWANAAARQPQAQARLQAAQALKDSRAQASAARGFMQALAGATRGNAGQARDSYRDAADAIYGYGNLALGQATGAQQQAARQAQDYIGTVAPVTGVPMPDYGGAMRALGTMGVTDPAAQLRMRAPLAQQAAAASRNAQLGSIADFGTGELYRGLQEANRIKAAAASQAAAARPGAVLEAARYINQDRREAVQSKLAQSTADRAWTQQKWDHALALNTDRRQEVALGITQDQQTLAWAEHALSVAKTNADIANATRQLNQTWAQIKANIKNNYMNAKANMAKNSPDKAFGADFKTWQSMIRNQLGSIPFYLPPETPGGSPTLNPAITKQEATRMLLPMAQALLVRYPGKRNEILSQLHAYIVATYGLSMHEGDPNFVGPIDPLTPAERARANAASGAGVGTNLPYSSGSSVVVPLR